MELTATCELRQLVWASSPEKTSGSAAAEALYIVIITGQEAWEVLGGVRQELPRIREAPWVRWPSHPPVWDAADRASGGGGGGPGVGQGWARGGGA